MKLTNNNLSFFKSYSKNYAVVLKDDAGKSRNVQAVWKFPAFSAKREKMF